MTDFTWFHLVGINPEPWTAPNVGGRRKNGSPVVYKNEGLRVYQEAIKKALEGSVPVEHERLEVCFYFWRRLDLQTYDERKGRSHRVDATNMQKALEDALQGILFDNDRNVVHVSSWIMEQAQEATPRILIALREAPAPFAFTEWPAQPTVSIPFGGIPAKEFVPPAVEEYF